jgi:hypothetical protein
MATATRVARGSRQWLVTVAAGVAACPVSDESSLIVSYGEADSGGRGNERAGSIIISLRLVAAAAAARQMPIGFSLTASNGKSDSDGCGNERAGATRCGRNKETTTASPDSESRQPWDSTRLAG